MVLTEKFTWGKTPSNLFYSSGPEIHQYMLDVVAAHHLRKYFKLRHQVTGAYWDEERGVWEIQVTDLSTKEQFVDTAEFLLNNEGVLK